MQARIEGAPLVTLLIPTFNRVELLKICVESVLAQTYKNIEIIVSDNCSSDGTASYLESVAGLMFQRHDSNIGMVGNWNSLLARARGEYCVLLSDDDILSADFVATLVAYINQNDCALAYTPVVIIDVSAQVIGHTEPSELRETTENFVQATFDQKRVPYPSAMMFRTADAQKVGLFSDIGNQTDVAFRVAIAELHPKKYVVCHPEALVRYRVHAAALTDDPQLRQSGRIKFQRWVARRYSTTNINRRLAVFDLLNLKAKGCSIEKNDFGFELSKKQSLFDKKVRWLASKEPISSALLVASCPVLATHHVLRLINNRRNHKRFLPN